MSKLLTIAIPTFNRAKLLDKQLEWLTHAIQGFESVCEVIVSDNCSTDDTSNVVKKWQSLFPSITFSYKKNLDNIGAVRNIASCIEAANGEHVWIVSDDDKIFDNSIADIVSALTKYPNLGLMILNFSKSDAKTGHVFEARCFHVDNDEFNSNGTIVFQRCLEESIGGVGLTTALVYRTDLAKRALENWITGLNNMAVQIYWTAYCARYGSALVTKDNYLECVAGTHYFMQNPKLLVTLEYADIPEVMLKLRDIGYSHNFSRKMVLSRFIHFNWKVLFGALRRWPFIATKAAIRYLIYVISAFSSSAKYKFTSLFSPS
jgi:abequosyltransferase